MLHGWCGDLRDLKQLTVSGLIGSNLGQAAVIILEYFNFNFASLKNLISKIESSKNLS